MIWDRFILSAMMTIGFFYLFVMYSKSGILRHRYAALIIFFFIAGSVSLLATIREAYTVKETFNPDTDDCTQWTFEKTGVGFAIKEGDLTAVGLRYVYKENDTNQTVNCNHMQSDERVTPNYLNCLNCVSWQPKQPKKCFRNVTNPKWLDNCCFNLNYPAYVRRNNFIDMNVISVGIYDFTNFSIRINSTEQVWEHFKNPSICFSNFNTSKTKEFKFDSQTLDAEKCSKTPQIILTEIDCL